MAQTLTQTRSKQARRKLLCFGEKQVWSSDNIFKQVFLFFERGKYFVVHTSLLVVEAVEAEVGGDALIRSVRVDADVAALGTAGRCTLIHIFKALKRTLNAQLNSQLKLMFALKR